MAISKLPFDVLLDIFEAGYLDRDNSHLCCRPFELQVSQVNRLWHYLAIGLPRLWSCIDIVNMPHRVLELYLERSRSFPLEVNLRLSITKAHPIVFDDIPSIAPELLKLKLAATHVSRWCRLAIFTPIHPSFLHSMACLSLHAPILQCISISDSPISPVNHPLLPLQANGPGEPFELFNHGAPCLTTLHLEGFGLAQCRFPIARLTTLSLFDTDPDSSITKTQFISFMLAMPNLRELSIKGDFVSDWDDPPLVTINAPSLCILRLWNATAGYTERYISAILLALYCPKCHTLVLAEMWEGDLLSFFARYQSILVPPRYPVLQSLVLVTPYILNSNFTSLAHAFPTVTHLAILHQWGRNEDDVPQLLIKSTSHGREILWPDLKSLTLCFIDVQTLQAIVTRRREIGRPLQKLCLMGVHPSNWNEIPETVALKGEVTVEEKDEFIDPERKWDLTRPYWLQVYDCL